MIGAFRPPATDLPVDWAIAYARAGLPVFPANATKMPLVKHGVHAATMDEETIVQWWQKWPHADPAWAVPAEIVIVDVDIKDRNGFRDFAALNGAEVDEIETPQATTPRGGRHLLLSAGSVRYGNKAFINGAQIDMRSAGGYVVLPAGGNGRKWLKGLSTPLAPAPSWLPKNVEVDDRPIGQARAFDGQVKPWTAAALRDACAKIVAATRGRQEHTLNAEALGIGQLVAGGEIDFGEARDALVDAGMQMTSHDTRRPWTSAVVRQKIERAMRDGAKNPRNAPSNEINPEAKEAFEQMGAASIADLAPRPLTSSLAPPKPYPIHALGSVLASAAGAIAERVQCSETLAAQSVLGVASLAAQALADVRLPHGQTRPLSLFLLTIAASGDRKTSADREAMIPVRMREATLREAYEPEAERYKVNFAAWRAERAAIERAKSTTLDFRAAKIAALGPEPEPPLLPVLTINEGTHEGLAKSMPRMHGAVGIFSAEAGAFLAGHGFTQEKKLATAAALSTLWDGDVFRRLRAGDGLTDLRGRRVAAHLMLQPEAASAVLADPVLRDQGLLARFLVAAPETLAGWRMWKEPPATLGPTMEQYTARTLSTLEGRVETTNSAGNELAPRVLELNAEALAAWIDFHDSVERAMAAGGRYATIRDIAGKAAEQAARIAGVLAIVDDRETEEIDGDAMLRGCVLAKWSLDETLRLVTAARVPQEVADAAELLKWLHDRGLSSFATTEVQKSGPNRLRAKTELVSAIGVLEDHQWLVAKTKTSWFVMPRQVAA